MQQLGPPIIVRNLAQHDAKQNEKTVPKLRKDHPSVQSNRWDAKRMTTVIQLKNAKTVRRPFRDAEQRTIWPSCAAWYIPLSLYFLFRGATDHMVCNIKIPGMSRHQTFQNCSRKSPVFVRHHLNLSTRTHVVTRVIISMCPGTWHVPEWHVKNFVMIQCDL